jgi:hypothetical protein
LHSAPPRSCTCSTRGSLGRVTEPRLSQAVAGRPLLCESGDHVTLSRRCSVWASSKVLACLLKVVALSTASNLCLLHQGHPFCRFKAPRLSQAVAGRPLPCERGDHVTISLMCLVRVSSKVLACLLKVVALSTAYSSYLLHQGVLSDGATPTRPSPAVAGVSVVCKSGDRLACF